MRDTGIVRRIDELGRVVIPKEIRKTLRIKEGDPLEIYTDKDQLLLKKFSPVEKLCEYSNTIATTLSDVSNMDCLICDRDEVVFSSCNRYKDAVGKKVSLELEKIMEGRQRFVAFNNGEEKMIKLFSGDEQEYNCQVIQPVVCQSEYYGSVILLGKNGDKPSDIDEELCEYSAKVIANYFE